MASQGTLICQAFSSNAIIPVEDATITVSQKKPTGGITLVAVRLTDRSGRSSPVTIDTPSVDFSTSPDLERSWTPVDITVDHIGYESIIVENVQVFPQTCTLQQLDMIPLSEQPESWNQTEVFVVPPQNL